MTDRARCPTPTRASTLAQLATRLEDQLDQTARRDLKALADRVRGACLGYLRENDQDAVDGPSIGSSPERLMEEYDETFETRTEYCLFARHEETDRPMLAHAALHEAPSSPYAESLRSIFRTWLNREALCEIVCVYAEQHRAGLRIPLTAFDCLLRPPLGSASHRFNFREEVLRRVLDNYGGCLAPAVTVNRFGETQLAALLRLDYPPQVLRLFMDRVPGARDALSKQADCGDRATPAHLCVKMNLPRHLELLISEGADLVGAQDVYGRTAFGCAEMHGRAEILGVFRSHGLGVSADLACLSAGGGSSSRQRARTRPTAVSLSLASRAADLKPAQVNVKVLEYVQKHMPRLVAHEIPLQVVPDIKRTCPYPEGTPEATGWNTEMEVLKAVANALKGLCSEHKNLRVICFHDLRYGCLLEGMGSWESDIDVAVLCYDVEKDSPRFALLMEVKGIGQFKEARDMEPGRFYPGKRALNQLWNHFAALRQLRPLDGAGSGSGSGTGTDATCSAGWVVPCAAFPNFTEEEELRTAWGRFLAQHNKTAGARNYSSMGPIHLLTRRELHLEPGASSPSSLQNWFNGLLRLSVTDPDDDDDVGRQRKKCDYDSLLAWCVTHAVGYVLKEVAKMIDRETSDEGPRNSVTLVTM